MAIQHNKIGGPATVEINGRFLALEDVTFNPGGATYEMVVAAGNVRGKRESSRSAPSFAGRLPTDGRWTLADIMEIKDETARIQLGNGDVWALTGVTYMEPPKQSSQEGLTDEISFSAMTAKLLK